MVEPSSSAKALATTTPVETGKIKLFSRKMIDLYLYNLNESNKENAIRNCRRGSKPRHRTLTYKEFIENPFSLFVEAGFHNLFSLVILLIISPFLILGGISFLINNVASAILDSLIGDDSHKGNKND